MGPQYQRGHIACGDRGVAGHDATSQFDLGDGRAGQLCRRTIAQGRPAGPQRGNGIGQGLAHIAEHQIQRRLTRR